MQRNYVFGKQGAGRPKTQSDPFSSQGGPYGSQPGGGYQQPKQNQGGFQAYQQPAQPQGGVQAYRPSQAQPVNRSQGSPYRPGPVPAPPQQSAVTGFPTYPAPVNGMIDGRPVAGKGRSPQEEIDRLKQMGTWDDPRNAKARERLEQRLNDYNTVPEGYFRTPDGRLEPNYLARVGFGSLPQPGMAQPVQQPYGSPYQPSPPAAPPMPQYPGHQAGPGMGGGYGSGGARTMEFRDRDGNGVDDRDQAGPGMGGGYQPAQQPSVPQVVGGKMNRGQRTQRQPRPSQGPRWRGDMPMIEGRGLPPQFQAPQQFQPPNPRPSYSDPAMNPNYRDSFQPLPRGAGFEQSSINAFGQVASPQQNMAQRDAFIARLNAERAPLAATAGVYQTGMAPTAPPLNRDFGSLWGQAGNMVANGWSNPLAGLFG